MSLKWKIERSCEQGSNATRNACVPSVSSDNSAKTRMGEDKRDASILGSLFLVLCRCTIRRCSIARNWRHRGESWVEMVSMWGKFRPNGALRNEIIKHDFPTGVCFKSKSGDLLVFHSHDSYDAAAQRRLAWVGQGLQEICRDSRRLLTDHQQSRQIECSKVSHGSKFFERIRRYYKESRRYSDSTFDAPIGCSNMEPLDNLAFQVQQHTVTQQHP